MKILLANKYFFLNGGSERVYFSERDYLLRNGFEVIDFSMKDERNIFSQQQDYFVNNLDYKICKGKKNRLRAAIKLIHSREAVHKIVALIEREKPDIAHLHNIYHQLSPSIIKALKKRGIKIVLTLHDGKLICPTYLMLNRKKVCTTCEGKHFHRAFLQNCGGSLVKSATLAFEAYWHSIAKSYQYVDLFLSPSVFLSSLVTKHRIAQNKVRILRNGIDTRSILPSYDIGEGYALFLGRLSHEKGIRTLLNAYNLMNEKCPIKIVGSGPLLQELHREYVGPEYLGYKEGEELLKLIQNASFVVVPSEWYENCSMVVLEAMAFGKPIVASRVGGIPEQVEDGKTGFLFEMGNAKEMALKMDILAKNHNLRVTMGKAARSKVEKEYSLSAHCQKLVYIYSQVIGRDITVLTK